MKERFALQNWQVGPGVDHRMVSAAEDCIAVDPEQNMTVFWHEDRPVGHWAPWSVVEPECFMNTAPARKQADAPEGSHQEPAAVSVVICTRDRPDELQRCLTALACQTTEPRQVLVVDNASRDRRVKNVANAAGADYLREDRPGLDYARNTGLSRAAEEIVAFVDDDVVVHRSWLQRLTAAFDRPEIAVVTGLVLPAELVTEAQCHFEEFWGFGRGYRRLDFDADRFRAAHSTVFPAWEIGAGASMALRREPCQQAGLFDERLDVGQAGCSGDSELWYRLLARGHTCRYEPSAAAFHVHRQSMAELSRQIYHYMRGHAAALLVQYERTGIATNRHRAFIDMPRWYGGRLWHRFRQGRNRRDLFLKEEVTGYLSGLLFYYRHRQPKHGRQ